MDKPLMAYRLHSAMHARFRFLHQLSLNTGIQVYLALWLDASYDVILIEKITSSSLLETLETFQVQGNLEDCPLVCMSLNVKVSPLAISSSRFHGMGWLTLSWSYFSCYKFGTPTHSWLQFVSKL